MSENFDVKNSSIATLCSETSENVISGLNSLGNFIQSQGYDAMPSMTHPNPASTGGKSNRKNNIDFTQLLPPRSYTTYLLLHTYDFVEFLLSFPRTVIYLFLSFHK